MPSSLPACASCPAMSLNERMRHSLLFGDAAQNLADLRQVGIVQAHAESLVGQHFLKRCMDKCGWGGLVGGQGADGERVPIGQKTLRGILQHSYPHHPPYLGTRAPAQADDGRAGRVWGAGERKQVLCRCAACATNCNFSQQVPSLLHIAAAQSTRLVCSNHLDDNRDAGRQHGMHQPIAPAVAAAHTWEHRGEIGVRPGANEAEPDSFLAQACALPSSGCCNSPAWHGRQLHPRRCIPEWR